LGEAEGPRSEGGSRERRGSRRCTHRYTSSWFRLLNVAGWNTRKRRARLRVTMVERQRERDQRKR